MIYPVLLVFVCFTLVFELFEIQEITMNIIFGVIILSTPAFMMLPGIIYSDFKASYHGLNQSQLYHSFFFGLTLGLGPIYLFFKYHDRELREKYKKI